MRLKPTLNQESDPLPSTSQVRSKIQGVVSRFTSLPRHLYLIIGLLLIFLLCTVSIFALRGRLDILKKVPSLSPQSQSTPTAEASASALPPEDTSPNSLDSTRPFSILILGIDRRHPYDTAFRSDVNIVATFSADRKKVLLTSIPRDLWMDNSRINAFVSTDGMESMKEKVRQVTGLKIDRFVQLDFDGLVDGVDALGGLDVEIANGFTDVDYPNDRAGLPGVFTVNFETGLQHLNGERALVFSRSRKGSNGEGSDFKRAARQQQLLKSMPAAFLSPKCVFNPFIVQNFYTAVTSKYETDFTLEDVKLAYNLLKGYAGVQIENLVLQPPTYLYQPSPDDYGGAYVLRPIDESFAAIHQTIRQKIQ